MSINKNRRAALSAFAGLSMIAAAPVYSNTFGFLKGAGNIRRIRMESSRSGEMLDMIYWIDGDYIKPALKEINWFMRDWRENKSTHIDYKLINFIAATHRRLDVSDPVYLLSGYRTARTNAMLRRRSRRVAKTSYHMKGMAGDIRIKSRSVNQIAKAAMVARIGGIGKYYRSNFVHLDSGPIRDWTS